MRENLLTMMIFLALAFIVSCQAAEQPKGAVRTIELKPCEGDSETQIALSELEALCGKYEVYEDRDAKKGRKIALNIAVVPALARNPKPDPLFILAGGPGQAATDVAPIIRMAFKKVRAHRDIVLVDQRGTGESNPLDCKPDHELALAELFRIEAPPEEIEECLKTWDANLQKYTTDIAMNDLNDVRVALGYDKINLWGGSYGTRAALTYLRQHGDTVRSAVIDGVAPQDNRLISEFAEDAERALNKLFEDCRKNPECHAAFPDLEKKLAALLGSLAESPQTVSLTHPRTGEKVEVVVRREIVRMAILGALYDTASSTLIPLFIDRASKGDFSIMAAFFESRSDLAESISYGMQLAVLCNEDLAMLDGGVLDKGHKGTYFDAKEIVHFFKRHCHYFEGGTVPKDYFEPVRSDVPTLVLSGDLDPVTPPRWGENAAGYLKNATHITVPGVGHGTSHHWCVSNIVAKFIDTASAANLDTDCLKKIKRFSFFVENTGPKALETKEEKDDSSE